MSTLPEDEALFGDLSENVNNREFGKFAKDATLGTVVKVLAKLTGLLPTTAVIYNINAAAISTEYSQLLPNGTKKMSIRSRGDAKIYYAFTSAAAETVEIPRGKSEDIDGINYSGSVYFSVSDPSQLVEIVAWV